jgi:hypothetical protein
MKKRLNLLPIVVVAMFCLAPRVPADESSVKGAQAAAEAWLAIVDSGRYSESWDEAAAFFKQSVTRLHWEEAVKKVSTPLGKLVSRALRDAQYTASIPNAPAGEYVVIRYDTNFENAKSAVETVTPMKDKDGVWRVSGYYIR